MKNKLLLETTDAWPLSKMWEQQEYMKLQRLKDLRLKMENMQQTINRYSYLISTLQIENKQLKSQNEQLKKIRAQVWQNKDIQYSTLAERFKNICYELEREKRTRQNCEFTIKALRNQLIQNNQTRKVTSMDRGLNIEKNISIEADYQVLLRMYQQVKQELYSLQSENLILKNVIRDQSKFSYEKQSFWKQNLREGSRQKLQKSVKDNKPGVIRTLSKSQESQKVNRTNSNKNFPERSEVKLSQKAQVVRSRKSFLQQQLKKQYQLIEKFKQTQQQQIKLIELLKSQKSKICLCNSQGNCENKTNLYNQQAIVSFKKDTSSNCHISTN